VETAVQSGRSGETDLRLVERTRAGDTGAFDEIVARHKRAVYSAARRLLGSHEDADEAAQIAFVRAWRALDGFRGDSSLRTWLVRIVLNVSKSLRTRAPVLDGLEGQEQLADTRAGSDDLLRRKESGEWVRSAVDRLPPRQREVVMLKVFSEMTHREVAGVLGLTEGAVKAHLHQAVSNLRRRMVGSTAGRSD
jgi:RNA polymerase sigma-70 factor (ECF subfamily)